MNVSSQEFLDRIRSRDPEAIAYLVRTYTRQLYRASRGIGFDEESANELVQNTWATFHEKAPTFEGRSHVRTYLFGILYNKASEARRDRQRHDVDDPVEKLLDGRFRDDGHWMAPPRGPEDLYLGREILEQISKCAAALPPAQRMAFWLREVEERTTEEICNIMGVTATNLGVLLFRGRNRLRECLEGFVATKRPVLAFQAGAAKKG